MEGQYDNNAQVGEWKFYISDILEQTYNFTTKEVVYSKKSDQFSNAFIGGNIQSVKLDTQPTYIGSKIGINDELNTQMTYPYQALRMGIEGKVLASLWISENGEVSNVKIIQGIMEECDKEVLKGISKMEKSWIAGTQNGQKVTSELFIVVEFKLHDNGRKTITVL